MIFQFKYLRVDKLTSGHTGTFEAKGKTDAHLLFSNCPDCDGYEIVIGGWGNTQSMLREGKQKKDTQQKVSTPNILSETEWRKFWWSYLEEGNTVRIS